MNETIQQPYQDEFNRFLTLFDRLISETKLWIEVTPKEKLDWIPIETPQLSFGDRLTGVTIRSLYVHLFMAEYKWIHDMKSIEDGAILGLPRDKAQMEELLSEDFIIKCDHLHTENISILQSYVQEDLNKNIIFAGDNSKWSVMGFLWGMWGHHAYHLGNIDMYVRQANCPTPDFFSFDPKTMA